MSAKDLSFKIPKSGLWSTATTSLLHPRRKCLAFCKASTTANNSPSTGEYRLSAGFVKRPPARTNFHPSLQQFGLISPSQSHHFCIRKNPIPCLDQSVARQVHRSFSKYFTPLTTASTIFSFARLNFDSRLSVHVNPDDHVSGFKRCRNSSMTADIANA